MSADFKIKAIETHYNNYRFRSRLEAKHAVFFDALGVKYEYEKEGFEFEGMRYLPDFWLPDYDCFVEIKGQEPTEEERRKAQLLSLYTLKDVHLFYGEIGVSRRDGRSQSINYTPPQLWKYLSSEGLGKNGTRKAHVAPDLIILRQKLEDCCLELDVNEDEEIAIVSDYKWTVEEIDEYRLTLQKQQELLKVIQELAANRKEELLDSLLPEEGWDYEFFEQRVFDNVKWLECTACGTLHLHFAKFSHPCKSDEGNFLDDTPRLMNAYKAARQARFEYGR